MYCYMMSQLDEMCAIMDGLHRYVPQVAVTRSGMASGGEQYSDFELPVVLFGDGSWQKSHSSHRASSNISCLTNADLRVVLVV